MGKKKLQGADGMNFQLQLTIKGLESINLPEENLTNESGNDIMKISCWGGKLSAYVNLPNAIRPNNVQPFQLSDCIYAYRHGDRFIFFWCYDKFLHNAIPPLVLITL